MQNRDTTKYITYFFNYFTIQYLALPKNSCSFAFEIMNRTFAYQEVKGVKEVKELRRMSCSLRTTPKRLLS